MVELRWLVVGVTERPRAISVVCDEHTPIGLVAHTIVERALETGSMLPVWNCEHGPLTIAVRRGPRGEVPEVENEQRPTAPNQDECGQGATARAEGDDLVVLDASDTVAGAGLGSGSVVRVVPVGRPGPRFRPGVQVAAWLTCRSERMGEVTYPVPLGTSTIGRGWHHRVRLPDPRISRHAGELALTVNHAGDIELQFTASGIAERRDVAGGGNGSRLPTTVRVGPVVIRAAPVAVGSAESDGHVAAIAGCPLVMEHVPSPAIVATPSVPSIDLPEVPEASPRSRMGIAAAALPAIMGVGAYLVTGQAAMLSMLGMSVVMMAGTWIDQWFAGRRGTRRGRQEFDEALAAAAIRLDECQRSALAALHHSIGDPEASARAIRSRSGELWSVVRGDPAHLAIAVGEATCTDLVHVKKPRRHSSSPDMWQRIDDFLAARTPVSGVPAGGRLSDWRNLGVVGPHAVAAQSAAAIVLQLVARHSPRSLRIVCAAAPAAIPHWRWLTWLPHLWAGGRALRTAGEDTDELLAALERACAARARRDASGEEPTIVVVADIRGAPNHRWLHVMEAGPGVGVHVVWLAGGVRELPSECRAYVECGESARLVDIAAGQRIDLDTVHATDAADADLLARTLAPLVDPRDRDEGAGELPRRVRLPTAAGRDLTDQDAIVEAWLTPDSALAGAVGIGADGPLRISLREDGPHALVGGTTGAGKSEFLQTWIVALAAAYSPEHVSFLLVDYKGGAAFADCAHLPHVVGMVTDLDPDLVRRVLVSLRAELHRREHVLARYGAKDLWALRRDHPEVTLPPLVIVVDEFAALVTEVPQFVDGVIDIAQRGRSLGLHLILATQRPAGVIRDNVRANTAIRVALRMADDDDSVDVIGVRDAARFAADQAGRAIIRRGSLPLETFQTAYLGSVPTAGPAVRIADLGFGSGGAGAMRSPDHPRRGGGRRDLEAIGDAIRGAVDLLGIRRARRPWLQPLPRVILLADVLDTADDGERTAGRQRGRGRHAGPRQGTGPVAWGLTDDPANQSQPPLLFTPAESGSLLIVGGPGSGKTTAIETLVGALGADAIGQDWWRDEIHLIDGADDLGNEIAALPCVTNVIPGDDEDRLKRLFAHLHERMGGGVMKRAGSAPARVTGSACGRGGARGADGGGGVRGAGGGGGVRGADGGGGVRGAGGENGRFDATAEGIEGRVFVFIDGLDLILERHEADLRSTFESDVAALLRASSRGVHVIATAHTDRGVPRRLLNLMGDRVDLRGMANDDLPRLGAMAGADDGDAAALTPGRGASGGLAVQVAVIGVDVSGRRAAIAALSDRLLAAGIGACGPVIAEVPTVIRWEDLAEIECSRESADDIRDGLARVAVDAETLLPVAVPTGELIVVTGAFGSGLTNALRCLIAGSVEVGRSAPGTPRTLLLASTPELAVQAQLAWDMVAIGPDDCVTAAEHARSGGAVPDLIVVAAAGGFADTAADEAIAELLREVRLLPVTVIVESDTVTGPRAWQIHAEIKAASVTIVLQPNDSEPVPTLSTPLPAVGARRLPPGRGFLVQRGRVQTVQMALPPG